MGPHTKGQKVHPENGVKFMVVGHDAWYFLAPRLFANGNSMSFQVFSYANAEHTGLTVNFNLQAHACRSNIDLKCVTSFLRNVSFY